MNTSQPTQFGKQDELNSVKYLTQVTGAQIFVEHQFQLSNLVFTMKSTALNQYKFKFCPHIAPSLRDFTADFVYDGRLLTT